MGLFAAKPPPDKRDLAADAEVCIAKDSVKCIPSGVSAGDKGRNHRLVRGVSCAKCYVEGPVFAAYPVPETDTVDAAAGK